MFASLFSEMLVKISTVLPENEADYIPANVRSGCGDSYKSEIALGQFPDYAPRFFLAENLNFT